MKLPRDVSGDELAKRLGIERDQLVDALFGK